MKKKRTTMIFYAGWREALQELPDAVRLQVYEAAMDYAMTGEAPELSGMAALAFTFIRQDIDKDRGKFDEICKRNSENARKRWNKEEGPDENEAADYATASSGINENATAFSHMRPYATASSRINENATAFSHMRPYATASSRIKSQLDNEYENEYEYENENINNSLSKSLPLAESGGPTPAERENFLSIFFFKGFVNPQKEVEDFVNHYTAREWIPNNSGKAVSSSSGRAALAKNWTPKSGTGRFHGCADCLEWIRSGYVIAVDKFGLDKAGAILRDISDIKPVSGKSGSFYVWTTTEVFEMLSKTGIKYKPGVVESIEWKKSAKQAKAEFESQKRKDSG